MEKKRLGGEERDDSSICLSNGIGQRHMSQVLLRGAYERKTSNEQKLYQGKCRLHIRKKNSQCRVQNWSKGPEQLQDLQHQTYTACSA